MCYYEIWSNLQDHPLQKFDINKVTIQRNHTFTLVFSIKFAAQEYLRILLQGRILLLVSPKQQSIKQPAYGKNIVKCNIGKNVVKKTH